MYFQSEHQIWCHKPGWTSRPESKECGKHKQKAAVLEGRSRQRPGLRPADGRSAVPARSRKSERQCHGDSGGRGARDWGQRVRTHRRGIAVSPLRKSAAPSEAALPSSLTGSSSTKPPAHLKAAEDAGGRVGFGASAVARSRAAQSSTAVQLPRSPQLLQLHPSTRVRAALTSILQRKYANAKWLPATYSAGLIRRRKYARARPQRPRPSIGKGGRAF